MWNLENQRVLQFGFQYQKLLRLLHNTNILYIAVDDFIQHIPIVLKYVRKRLY